MSPCPAPGAESGAESGASRPSAIDLFCGCGGWSVGAASCLDVKLGVDLDARAVETYRRNLGSHAHIADVADALKLDALIGSVSEAEEVDVILGSPPCQDFSNSGQRVEAERASLALEFAATVAWRRPRLALMENVPRMLRSRTFQEVCKVLRSAGYGVVCFCANAAACGVAQDRRRAFVVAARDASAEALEELRRRAARLDHVPADAPTMASCLDRDARASADSALVWYTARNRWQPCVYRADRPSPTLRCNCLAARPPHYERRHDDAGDAARSRVLSVDEAARVASFPSGYFAGCSRAAASRMIGNAVPPAMARTVVELCLALLLPSQGRSPPLPLTLSPEALPAPSPTPLPAPQPPLVGVPAPHTAKRGRIERLRADPGWSGMGMTYDAARGRLEYVGGATDAGDAALLALLRWRPLRGWRVVLQERATQTTNRDDFYVFVPGHAAEFRSFKQLQRTLGADAVAGCH